MQENIRIKLKSIHHYFSGLKLHHPSRQTAALFIVALGMFAFSFGFKLSGVSDPSFNYQPIAAASTATAYQPETIRIPGLNLSLPVQEGSIINGRWQINGKGVTHLVNSAVPGQKGNVVIYGHNTNNILGNLSWIQSGQVITVSTHGNRIFRYRVTGIRVAGAEEIKYVMPTSVETLTVFTCTGFADTKRLVVQALPLL